MNSLLFFFTYLILFQATFAINLKKKTNKFEVHKSRNYLQSRSHGFFQEWQDFYENILINPPINLSEEDSKTTWLCNNNPQWDQYTQTILQSNPLPQSPVPPTANTCSSIFLYTLNENSLNYYVNGCLRANQISVKNKVLSTSLPMNNLLKFANNLYNEIARLSSETCDTAFSTEELIGGDLNLIRCSGYPTSDNLNGKTHVMTNSFLSTSIANDCNPTYVTPKSSKFHFIIKRDDIKFYGRDTTRFSAHPDENEFLLLPGSCFKINQSSAFNTGVCSTGTCIEAWFESTDCCPKDKSKIVML